MDMGPILIVEDDESIREMLFEALEQEGYQPIAASNGADGIAAMRLRHPEVVLLDFNMPILDGNGFLRCLREDGIRARVLVMTADPRGRQLTPSDGVCGHVPKPFDLDDLFAAIQLADLPATGGISATA
jgi:DNA-binding response OmpR family regulator